MRFLNDLRIGRRLGLAFALSIMFSVLLAGYARAQLQQINTALELMVEDRLVKVQQLEAIKDHVNEIAQSVRDVVMLSDFLSEYAFPQYSSKGDAFQLRHIKPRQDMLLKDEGFADHIKASE